MALLALVFAGVFFGSLLGWFYRREIYDYSRDVIQNKSFILGKSKDSKGLSGSHNSSNSNSCSNVNNNCYDVHGSSTMLPPPVPPPRNKTNRFYSGNSTTNIQITPEEISKPMQVTINGLAV